MSETIRKKYSQELKQDAVKLVTEQGYKISEAASNRAAGICLIGASYAGPTNVFDLLPAL